MQQQGLPHSCGTENCNVGCHVNICCVTRIIVSCDWSTFSMLVRGGTVTGSGHLSWATPSTGMLVQRLKQRPHHGIPLVRQGSAAGLTLQIPR